MGGSYSYDAQSRYISRKAGRGDDELPIRWRERPAGEAGATTAATYTCGNALIRKDGETPLFDGLGSERTVTNGSGAVQGTLTLSAFGQTVTSTGSSTSAYQFGATSGYRTEGDSRLTLVGCRFYDAQVGQFITRDTYLDQKPYAYCDGDPVNRLDPNGHSWVGWGAGLAMTLAIAAFITCAVVIEVGTAGLATPIIMIGGGFVAGAVGGAVRAKLDNDDPSTDMAQDGVAGAVTGGVGYGGARVGAALTKDWIRTMYH